MSIMSEPHLEVVRHWMVILVLFFKVQVWLPVENLFYTGLIPIMRSIHQGRCRGPHQLPVRLGKYNKKFREIDFPEKIVKSIFSQIRVGTWIKSRFSGQKTRPMIGWPSSSTNYRLGFWREIAWTHDCPDSGFQKKLPLVLLLLSRIENNFC